MRTENSKIDKRVGILFGTFDILHKGHLNLFRQARQRSDYLIVVVARDKTVKEVKNRYPVNSEKKRKKTIESSGLIDKVILGSLKDKLEAINKYQPDIVFLGYDQVAFTEELHKELERNRFKFKILRLKPFKPEIYKTSLILSQKYENKQ